MILRPQIMLLSNKLWHDSIFINIITLSKVSRHNLNELAQKPEIFGRIPPEYFDAGFML